MISQDLRFCRFRRKGRKMDQNLRSQRDVSLWMRWMECPVEIEGKKKAQEADKAQESTPHKVSEKNETPKKEEPIPEKANPIKEEEQKEVP